MSLETAYQNTDVVLSKRLTRGQKNGVRYIRCLALIGMTLLLVTVDLIEFLLYSGLIALVAWLLAKWICRRPRILLNTESRTLQMSNSFFFWKRRTYPAQQVQRVAVSLETGPGGRRFYRPQLVIKNPDKPAKPITVNCFDLHDIVESHYAAQLMAAFARVRGYDIKGNVLPGLKSCIPTKFLAGVDGASRAIPVRLSKKSTTSRAAV
ncbi:hypothetical protein [Nitrospina gracilis]|uniref:hypothetical protein n=1 Tax=Nitrospina gracilis TaxID=35801 RepID=UPI001F27206C|nr:hypothetical protein [Nitrospina gracilis]MCF8721922.1 hypothetical protein [Nitrospina gracilis Nb-211]